MKKLMMFVGAAMIACATQAAAVKWSTGAISDHTGTKIGTSTAYTCQLFFFTDAGYTTKFTVTSGDTDTTASLSNFGLTTSDDFAAETTYYVYAKVTSNDGKWSMTSGNGSFTTMATGNATINFSTATTLGGTSGSLWTTGTGWVATAVPEPATVGLLLLGLCAVGLKRRV